MSRCVEERPSAVHDGESGFFIRFANFLQLVLDFQLQGHDRFLMRFRELFRAVDEDADGVIGEVQFMELISRVSPAKTDEEIRTLMEEADPANSGTFTYSDTVTCMSVDIVEMMITVAQVMSSAEWAAVDVK